MKIKQIKENEQKELIGNVFFEIEYVSRYANTYKTKLYKFGLFSEVREKEIELKKEYDQWKLLSEILDCDDDKYYFDNNIEVKEEYPEIFSKFNIVPQDVTCDEFKTAISKITIIGFDKDLNKYVIEL